MNILKIFGATVENLVDRATYQICSCFMSSGGGFSACNGKLGEVSILRHKILSLISSMKEGQNFDPKKA